MDKIVFLIKAADSKGLVCKITTFFFERGFNIVNCQQHTDTMAGNYFMRIELDMKDLATSRHMLEEEFGALAAELSLDWSAHYTDRVARMAILASKTSHCLYDLLTKQREGELRCEVPLIASNHPDLEYVAEQFRIPFYCLPVGRDGRAAQEARLLDLLRRHHVDLVVMARYMQILSPEFIANYPDRVINIHHAFLPAFQGANPYLQAYNRGVKLIGATAHYATAELDGGPIIEQDVERVTHEDMPDDLRMIGRDIERVVLTRAVRAHLERRVIVFDNRTVVFS